jgi:GGDEF domain-containing protein
LSLLDREIDHARHGNGHLVLAYIDVDGLKQVNDATAMTPEMRCCVMS